MEQFKKARASYQTIIDHIFKKDDSSEYIGQAWHNIAVTFKVQARDKQAIEAYEQAEAYHAVESSHSDRFTTWLDLSETYLLMQDYLRAYEYGKKALNVYNEVSLLPDHYKVYDILSQITHAQERYDISHSYSQEYMSVNKRFLEAQEEILRVKDQFKMEVLTAGFFVELNADKRQSELEWFLIALGAFSALIIVLGRLHFLIKKKSIKTGLTQIENDSAV